MRKQFTIDPKNHQMGIFGLDPFAAFMLGKEIAYTEAKYGRGAVLVTVHSGDAYGLEAFDLAPFKAYPSFSSLLEQYDMALANLAESKAKEAEALTPEQEVAIAKSLLGIVRDS